MMEAHIDLPTVKLMPLPKVYHERRCHIIGPSTSQPSIGAGSRQISSTKSSSITWATTCDDDKEDGMKGGAGGAFVGPLVGG
eukprot:15344356-Ditylum_brightwellii.AAC.1